MRNRNRYLIEYAAMRQKAEFFGSLVVRSLLDYRSQIAPDRELIEKRTTPSKEIV